MLTVQHGSNVTFSYIGTLDNGKIFHSSDEEAPISCTIGADQVFPALERGLIGMRSGEVRNVVLSAAEGYGPRLQENIIQVARETFPAGKEISIGQKLSIEFAGGVTRVMIVTAVDEAGVTLDGNHPLAGCELCFAVRVDRVE
jgi:FKBP-type peptidyl-prolyl cis-trans isomerase 2